MLLKGTFNVVKSDVFCVFSAVKVLTQVIIAEMWDDGVGLLWRMSMFV
jgi:hypothetical protein